MTAEDETKIASKKLLKAAEVASKLIKDTEIVARELLTYNKNLQEDKKLEDSNTLDNIKVIVKEAVEIQINGNLREIHKEQNLQGETLKEIGDHLLKQDETLKRLDDKVQPAIRSFDWVISTGKVIMWISIAIGSIGGAILIIKQFIVL